MRKDGKRPDLELHVNGTGMVLGEEAAVLEVRDDAELLEAVDEGLQGHRRRDPRDPKGLAADWVLERWLCLSRLRS